MEELGLKRTKLVICKKAKVPQSMETPKGGTRLVTVGGKLIASLLTRFSPAQEFSPIHTTP